ncbi:ATP-binding protein [Chloroflexus sp.]|uniref:ATP-binding protein n=1 Tax=Chloroflexus sp. TaxID=1904827 RepID=UPI002ACE030D|nr:ATP-binding protein [Chloroflexus sp.]
MNPTVLRHYATDVIDAIWHVIGAVNIRAKILGIVLGLVTLMGIVVTIEVRLLLEHTLTNQAYERSTAIARDVAARATDLVLMRDYYGLFRLLRDTQVNNPDLRYAFVMDSEGTIIAHTFGAGFPPNLRDANTVTANEHHRSVLLTTDEGEIWDTAVPIFDGRAGIARVGLSLVTREQTVAAMTGQLLLTTMMVAAVGITAAALLTWILTRPILQLVELTQAVARGDFNRRASRWANDELGALIEAFNAMSEALAQAAQERTEREQMQTQFVAQVIAAQEEERKRIARELHDSTGQALTSLLIGLRSLAERHHSPDINRQINDLRGIVGQVLKDLHGLARQLRPSVLDDLGLAAALQRYIAECRARSGLIIDLTLPGLADSRLDPVLETALYRIVQEALTNVIRHANATTASVVIERQSDQVRAIIEDDGCGFDPNRVSGDGHLGLQGIRERAALLNGRLIIESTPGHGTTLYIELPLPVAKEEVDEHHSVGR